MYLLDSNVSIRGVRDALFGHQLEEFHRTHPRHLVVRALVVSELLVGARTLDGVRALRRTLVERVRSRRRVLMRAWPTSEWASEVDRAIRELCGHPAMFGNRPFVDDIPMAATARETGATIVTFHTADFALVGRHVDIAVVEPWLIGSVA